MRALEIRIAETGRTMMNEDDEDRGCRRATPRMFLAQTPCSRGGRTLRAVSNHTYTLLGCSTFRYGIKRTTHPLPTEGVIMALRGVAAESAAREEIPRGEEMS